MSVFPHLPHFPNPQLSILILRPETLSSTSCCSLQARVLPTPRSYVRADGAVAPDHWLEPSTVWEVRCADLSLSPIYPAARGLVSDCALGDAPKNSRGVGGVAACRRLPFLGGGWETASLRFIWESDNGQKSHFFFFLREITQE